MNNLLVICLNEPELICLHTVKWFQVLLFNTIYSIQNHFFVYPPLNGFRYNK